LGRKRHDWMRKPHKPLPVRDEPQHIKKSPKAISITRADGTIEVIKEG